MGTVKCIHISDAAGGPMRSLEKAAVVAGAGIVGDRYAEGGGTGLTLDNEEKIARVVGSEHVMGGVAYIFSAIVAPRVVAHTGGPARIVFGEMDGSRSQSAGRSWTCA
jgi:hypothetical protein